MIRIRCVLDLAERVFVGAILVAKLRPASDAATATFRPIEYGPASQPASVTWTWSPASSGNQTYPSPAYPTRRLLPTRAPVKVAAAASIFPPQRSGIQTIQSPSEPHPVATAAHWMSRIALGSCHSRNVFLPTTFPDPNRIKPLAAPAQNCL